MPVQLGRRPALRAGELDQALAAGVSRVVLGTAAFTDAELLGARGRRARRARGRVGRRCRGGFVATAGLDRGRPRCAPLDAVAALAERGVRNFIYTDVDRDGMLLGGLDLPTKARGGRGQAVTGELVYSGGIRTPVQDLASLAALARQPKLGSARSSALRSTSGRFTVGEASALLCS